MISFEWMNKENEKGIKEVFLKMQNHCHSSTIFKYVLNEMINNTQFMTRTCNEFTKLTTALFYTY